MKVFIKPECYAEIMYYVNKSSIEISGLGRVRKLSSGDLYVSKIYLLEQENSASTTDLNEEAVAKCLFETREDREAHGDLNFWWHSHVNMGAFWSGTDDSTIKQFGDKGYLVATVFNKKAEHLTCIYRGGDDFFPAVRMDKVDTYFQHIPTAEVQKGWEKNYEDLCKTKTYNYSGGTRWDSDYPAGTSSTTHYRRWNRDKGDWDYIRFGSTIPERLSEIVATQPSENIPRTYPDINAPAGTYSGASLLELNKFVWELSSTKHSYNTLTAEEQMMLLDVMEMFDDWDNPTPKDIKEFLNDLRTDNEAPGWVNRTIREEVIARQLSEDRAIAKGLGDDIPDLETNGEDFERGAQLLLAGGHNGI